MKIQVIKTSKPALDVDHLIKMYATRMKPFCTLELHQWKESELEERLKSHRKTGDFLVLLDETGKHPSTKEFSKQLSKWIEDPGTKSLLFLVGGPYGVTDAVKKSANYTLSLSALTLQGDLAWVVLMEQLYRAFTVLKNISYHHE